MAPAALLTSDPLFLRHRAEGSHPERPERLRAAEAACEALASRVSWLRLRARDASDDELLRLHTADYLHTLGQAAGREGMLDADTYICPDSVAAARRAAGASLELVDGLLDRRADFGVALLRPPGHHARPGAAMGFCLLNNAALAAAHARARGAERVLVLDWDVHHGNGTQEMFYDDPSVLYVSLHQFPYYPGTGATNELGQGEGRGYTVNVPLSAGATDAVYLEAFERVVCPIIESFRPSVTLLSAGFDAHHRDPLGGMALTDEGYFALTRKLLKASPERTPLGLLLEGGYDLAGLSGGLTATIEALAQAERGAPQAARIDGTHAEELERAEKALLPYWKLA